MSSRLENTYNMVLRKRGQAVITNVNIRYPGFSFSPPFEDSSASNLAPGGFRSYGFIPLPLPPTVQASWLGADGVRHEVTVHIPEALRPRKRDDIVFTFNDDERIDVERIDRKAIENSGPGRDPPLFVE